MKIFIGSSSEATEDLERIAAWIENLRYKPILWTEAFPPGLSTFTKLVDLTQSVDAAIFVFSEDDEVQYQSNSVRQPRDNVMLEYGLFLGALGTSRVAFCRKGHPKTASDLLGVTYVDISESCLHAAKVQLRSWLESITKQNTQSPAKAQEPASHQVLTLISSELNREEVCMMGKREYVDLVERLDPEHRLDHSPLFLALLHSAPGLCKELNDALIKRLNLPSGLEIEGVYDVFGPYDVLVKLRAPNLDYDEIRSWLLNYLGPRFFGPMVEGAYKREPTLIDVSHEFCRIRRRDDSASSLRRGITAFVHITDLRNDSEVFKAFEKCKAVKLQHGPAAQITGAYLAHKELVAQFYLTCGGYYDLAKVVYALESELQKICNRDANRDVTLLAMSAWENS